MFNLLRPILNYLWQNCTISFPTTAVKMSQPAAVDKAADKAAAADASRPERAVMDNQDIMIQRAHHHHHHR